MKTCFPLIVSLGLALAACHADRKSASNQDPGPGLTSPPSTYERLAQGLFEPSCSGCHNTGAAAGGIDLTSWSGITQGRLLNGTSLVMSGRPDQSRLYEVIAARIMPPGGTVDQDLQNLLACWISSGALESGDNCETQNTAIVPGDPAPVPPAPGPTPPAPTPVPEPIPSETPLPAITFATIFKDVLDKACARCHTGADANEGVDVTQYEALLTGSAIYGAADDQPSMRLLVPGKPEESLLWKVIETNRMPPRAPLTPEQKAFIKSWIEAGAAP